MSDFAKFSAAVHARYMEMGSQELFQMNLDKDSLYAAYLAAFPEGTNPIFRERTEHDCSCCRNFIKNLGSIVAIKDGRMVTVWGGMKDLPYPYDIVAHRLNLFVLMHQIAGVYRTKENIYGLEKNFELVDGVSKQWNHLFGTTYPRHRSATPEADAGTINSTVAVFKRGLEEITTYAIDTVIGLIGAKALYRGEEFLSSVTAFGQLKAAYIPLDTADRDVFAWGNGDKPSARIRNTAIGTLLQDLSEGVELEVAVASFEKKVAPENYKRTTALITPVMIKKAVETLQDLGLESAVKRRFANLSDVTINNVIWADNSAKAVMADPLTTALMSSNQVKKTSAKAAKAGDIGIDEFMADVVPMAKTIEVLMTNGLTNNLVSLTAPVDASVGNLFNWKNNFGWSYNGNITDSIKEKVKRAGGRTESKLRVSLAWFNSDDLDIHTHCPDGHIYFANKGRILDVDMNAGGNYNSTDPVENLSWDNPRDGDYRIGVNQYNKRSNDNVGFVLEVENAGKTTQYSFNRGVSGTIEALMFTVRNGVITEMKVGTGLTGKGISKEIWGIATESFVKVETLMYSPNHWDDNKSGNKHWFFMLEGCKNDEPTRGFYNEFLKPELIEHRKVFEVLGAQTMCPVVQDQLSGLGFSSTRNDVVTVRVDGQSYKVQF